MALPSIMRKLFRNDGYGPLLKSEIIPFAADFASNAADVATSTKWVKDLAVAPVYLDQNGLDTNDGLSAQTPVQTFEKAFDIASKMSQNVARIIVSGGTYAGFTLDSYVTLESIFLEISGNISINGNIVLSNNKNVRVFSDTINVTINGCIYITNSSKFILNSNIIINSTSDDPAALDLNFCSSFFVVGNVTITTVSSGLRVNNNSVFYQNSGTISITNDTQSGDNGIQLSDNSCFISENSSIYVNSTSNYFYMGVIVSRNSLIHLIGSSLNVSKGAVRQYGLDIDAGSTVWIHNDSENKISSTICGSTINSNHVISVSTSCTFVIQGNVELVSKKCYTDTNGSNLFVECSSAVLFYDGAIYSAVMDGATSSNSAMYSDVCSAIYFGISSTIWIGSGAWGRVIGCTRSSAVLIRSTATVGGSASATGKRYAVDCCSCISVQGAGANRIPGSTAGTATSSSFGYYG